MIAGTPRTFPRGAVPFNAVVDPQGRIAAQKRGFRSKAGIRAVLDRALGK